MRKNAALLSAALAAGSLVLTACEPESTEPTLPSGVTAVAGPTAAQATMDGSVATGLQAINAELAARGAPYAVDMAEISISPEGSADAATIVYAFDRTHRLTSKWVPGDPRRNADGNNITYMNDGSFMNASGAGNGEAAIDASFATWAGVNCSNLPLVKRPDNGLFNSAIFVSNGDVFAADIITLGFLPGAVFDQVLGPGASQNVLGVTFTFIFGSFDAMGNFTPSDIDNNHRDDTALKEVWYNNAFLWTTSNAPGVDIETVALHENGHALELGHFGRVAQNTKTGKLTVSPRAVMNAFILGVLRSPNGTDNSSYCGNWASWPN